jgi:Uma2 family endonuclease
MKNTVESPPVPLRGAPLWPLSVAAYRVLGEAGLIPQNTELLYGFVYTKMSKSPFHSFLLQFLHEALSRVLPSGRLLRTEQPITCSDSEPEPDLAVISGRNEDFRHDHPRTAELVIEVCVISHEYDRSKLRAYATADVKECWFVLGPEKKIEAYRQPKNGEFTEHTVHELGGTLTSAIGEQFTQRTLNGPSGQVTSIAVPGISVELDALFAT